MTSGSMQQPCVKELDHGRRQGKLSALFSCSPGREIVDRMGVCFLKRYQTKAEAGSTMMPGDPQHWQQMFRYGDITAFADE